MAMIKHEGPFPTGYHPITAIGGPHDEMLMDFGILKLAAGGVWRSDADRERAVLLLTGKVRFVWTEGADETTVEWARGNVLDQEPVALHAGPGVRIGIEALEGEAELVVQARPNPESFPTRLWRPGDYRSERFGEGTLQETSTRIVRTIFDAAGAPHSRMVLGEVVNFPGKWSSYPPHDHPHPEIYHYRVFPDHGHGHAECEDEVYKITSGDTYAIPPGVTHAQCAAPGYALYYVWAIPHLPGNRFGPDSRVFRREHTWLIDRDAPIWPDAPLETVLAHKERR